VEEADIQQHRNDGPLHNELPVYPTHPYSPALCAQLSEIPEAFSEIAVGGNLSTQIIGIIVDFSATTTEATTTNQAHVDQTNHRQSGKPGRNSTQLLTDLQRLATLQTTPIEHLLCHALIGYCFLLYYPGEMGPLFTGTLETLRDAFVEYNAQSEVVDRDCFIWMAMVIEASLQTSEMVRTKGVVLNDILDKYVEVRNWDRLESILRRFLWNDVLMQNWKACWATVMERRQST